MNSKELTLKEIQQESFNILKKIKEIFDKNGWKYYLTYGTLIGTIRHEGFIPWDDDIDIWVPRNDYEKFIQYCKENKETLKPFELFHYSTNEKFIYPIARFSDSRYFIDYKDTIDYGLGLFVDIYPIDDFNIDYKKHYSRYRREMKYIKILGRGKFVPSKSKLKTILKYPHYLMIKNRNLNKLLKKFDESFKKYSSEKSEYFLCGWEETYKKYSKESLHGKDNLECMKKFNGELFRVPYKYDELLRIMYGDYMKLPPENERIGHHFYKVYKK